MATQNFINECKKRANANRLGKFNIDNLEVNQTNHLSSIELKESCYVNDTIIGSIYTKSADIQLLNIPANTELEGKIITPEIGVRYDDGTTEYVEYDEYTIETINDEQTTSSTKFSAMNGGTLLENRYECSLSFENGETHTINEFYQDACSQLGLTPLDETFDNSEIVMTGNPFTNKEPIRTVLEEVERVSCSIIEFNWKNKTISLTWLKDEIGYEFNTSDYSTLEGSLTKYGPLNCVILGNSQLDGENVTIIDEESVEINGEHQIMIDAPYFLYTEELRRQAIQSIYNKLDGLTYYDIKLTTPYGKPFLKLGDKIRINTNEGQTYDTYILTHTLTYNGAIQSIIESPALTSEEQKIKNEMKNNTIKERIKRTELIVDKTTGDITAITERVTTTEDELGNMYSKEQINTLIQNAQTGITNTFSEAGGNNIFRNTGLWFKNNGEDRQENPYEYWNGNVSRKSNDMAVNNNSLLLMNGLVYQEQEVANGLYTVSFKYKKDISLAEAIVYINDIEYVLNGESGEFETGKKNLDGEYITQPLSVNSRHIKVEFECDTDNGVEIYDLMVNAGGVKLAYSQNQNETTTDTVNISKGIEIKSSNIDTTFRADADGIRIIDRNNNVSSKFIETGMENNTINVKEEATITDIYIQRVGGQVWFTKIR